MISALDGCDGWNGGDHTQNNPGLPLFKKKKSKVRQQWCLPLVPGGKKKIHAYAYHKYFIFKLGIP